MSLLVQLSPKQAGDALVEMFRKCKGNTTRVAERYRVVPSTVKRWITMLDGRRLGVRRRIEKVREEVA
jgi:hypothetical protein